MYSFTQRNLRSIALLIFRQFRLSLKCSQSRRLNNYTLCSIGNCGGNYPISNTTANPGLKKRKIVLYRTKFTLRLLKKQ